MINQTWDPDTYAEASYVPDMGREVVELLAPQPGERVLDLGCGDGVLSQVLVDAGCEVVGADASAALVAAARARGIDAREINAESLPFNAEFDAVFSNAALHWMTSPAAVLAGVQRALRSGGRFVAEFGGEGNVAAMRGALDDALARRGVTVACPWFFPAPARYRELLEAAGLQVRVLRHFPRQVFVPGDVRAWLQTFAQHYLNAVPEAERSAVLDDALETLRHTNVDDDGRWFVDYVRLRLHAVKP